MHIGSYTEPTYGEFLLANFLLYTSILCLSVLCILNSLSLFSLYKNKVRVKNCYWIVILFIAYLLFYISGYNLLLTNTHLSFFYGAESYGAGEDNGLLSKITAEIHNLPNHIIYLEYLHKTLITLFSLSWFVLLIKKVNQTYNPKKLTERNSIFRRAHYFFTKLLPLSICICLLGAILYSFFLASPQVIQ